MKKVNIKTHVLVCLSTMINRNIALQASAWLVGWARMHSSGAYRTPAIKVTLPPIHVSRLPTKQACKMSNILQGQEDLSHIEAGIINKFRWQWLQESDENNEFYSDYIRKVKQEGKALCITCNKMIVYGRDGKKALKQHSKTKIHNNNRSSVKNTQSLPASFSHVGHSSICVNSTQLIRPKMAKFL